MNFTVGADDQQFELSIRIRWQSIVGLLKALLPVIAAVLSFMAAPEVINIGTRLGLW